MHDYTAIRPSVIAADALDIGERTAAPGHCLIDLMRLVRSRRKLELRGSGLLAVPRRELGKSYNEVT